MGERTKIQWTDHTFNPWIGCQKVSEGCNNCYAEGSTFVRIQRKGGRELWGNRKRSERHVTSAGNWRKPLTWNAAAQAAGIRARVFCASLADVFEDRPELAVPRVRLFRLIAATPWLDWQLLTKRPENVMRMALAEWQHAFPPNVWIGTSVENQDRADERIPHLLRIPARVRFLSCEPLLGPVDLTRVASWVGTGRGVDVLRFGTWDLPGGFVNHGDMYRDYPPGPINWVIVGGESGPGARPFDVAWARDLIRQCREAGSAAFVKQLGALPHDGVHVQYGMSPFGPVKDGEEPGWIPIRDPKGGDWDEWPADLRVREMPEPAAVEGAR